jgi:hypothetical protein
MPAHALFISYGHVDMEPFNWLERLKLYLAPLRRKELVDVWDDSKIRVGTQWHQEIQTATQRASSAILLVGPGFLASEFIVAHELPVLLDAANTRGARIYPVIVGYCGYKQSVLGKYQAVNDPDSPLESLSVAEQNKILNHVSLTVDEDLRHAGSLGGPAQAEQTDTRQALRQIAQERGNTWTAFLAQCRRRDELVEMIRTRLGVRQNLEYERFFFQYYDRLNKTEQFLFKQIRAMTEGPLYEGNMKILRIVDEHPQVLDEVPMLADVRQHLVFWLNKYDKVFAKQPEMCVLYTGVEDGVPFPEGVDEEVAKWLDKHA